MKDCVVIGAGPAGLATSAALTARGVDHVVLERGRAGHTWRTQRWDGLRLNNPGWMNPMLGEQPPHSYLTAAEVVERLERLAARTPLREHTAVTALSRRNSGWVLHTSDGPVPARTVVVATGGENVPRIPAQARQLPARITQLHSADYRRHDGLPLEQVRQTRQAAFAGVGTLDRLGELHLVAHEDDRSRRGGHRDEVAERDLAGLVHEQHIARGTKLLTGKEPGCPCKQRKRRIDLAVVHDPGDEALPGEALALAVFLLALSGSSASGGSSPSGSSSSVGTMSSCPSANSSMPNSGTAERGRDGSSETRFCWWTSRSSRSAMSARPGWTRSTRLRMATALATNPSPANSSASPSRTGTASSIRPACIRRSASWRRTPTAGTPRPWSCRRNVSMALPRFLCAISSPMSASRGVLSQSRGIAI